MKDLVTVVTAVTAVSARPLSLLLALAIAPASRAAEPVADAAPNPQMQAWIRAAAPGPSHKALERLTGEWDTTSRRWQAADRPCVTASGRATLKMTLDGRFVEEEAESATGAFAFRGFGLTGFDNVKGKYTAVWVDTMSTAIYTMLGDCAPGLATCRWAGTYQDPVTARTETMRMVVTLEGPDRRVAEFFMPGADGREFRSGEVVYTRRR